MDRIILDNGGGITLQLGDWAHSYEGDGVGAVNCAQDIWVWLREGHTDGWEGHEDGAMGVEPTDDEVRNGGYLVIVLDRAVDTLRSLVAEMPEGWHNGEQLADALRDCAYGEERPN